MAGAPRDQCGIPGGQTIPGNKQQRLAFSRRQFAQRREHGGSLDRDLVRPRRVTHRPLERAEFPVKALLPGDTAAPVGDGIAGDHQQPRQRVVWNVVQPSPGNEENIANNILPGARTDVAKRVGKDTGRVLLEERPQAIFTLR